MSMTEIEKAIAWLRTKPEYGNSDDKFSDELAVIMNKDYQGFINLSPIERAKKAYEIWKSQKPHD